MVEIIQIERLSIDSYPLIKESLQRARELIGNEGIKEIPIIVENRIIVGVDIIRAAMELNFHPIPCLIDSKKGIIQW